MSDEARGIKVDYSKPRPPDEIVIDDPEGTPVGDNPTVRIRYNDATHQWEKVDG